MNIEINRLVMKVGTATIAGDDGRLREERMAPVVEQASFARRRGVDVVLVSSGAIAAGMEMMNLREQPNDMPTTQAVASIGQGKLVEAYTKLFAELGIPVGQVLLTQHAMIERDQYLNARNTLERLVGFGAVPVVNENDTVATEEIAFGENDFLAAQVAAMIRADLLLLLTDTAGLFTEDPRTSDGAQLVERVEEITEEIESMGGGVGSRFASGGMLSKIQAAKIAVCSGVGAVIADGGDPEVVPCLLEGECRGTYFPPKDRAIPAKKVWIAFAKPSRGTVVLDQGAVRAIEGGGKSLLAAGIAEVEGDFSQGEAVDVCDRAGRKVGKGIVRYGSELLSRMKGLRSDELESPVAEYGGVVIHRDSLVVYKRSFGAQGI